MSECLKIDISGINPDFVNTLQEKYAKNLKIVSNNQNETLQIQISKPVQEKFIINTLDNFLTNLQNNENKELTPSWFFNENNSIISGPDEKYFLTKREVKFIKMLLNSAKIITYTEMTKSLWDSQKKVSKNAMRLFTKNFKKKLPPNILMNYQNIGYKLIS